MGDKFTDLEMLQFMKFQDINIEVVRFRFLKPAYLLMQFLPPYFAFFVV